MSTDGGSLCFDDPERFILDGPERTTPSTVRDAEGATARADLAVGDAAAGPHCGALAGDACADATSYWNFQCPCSNG